MLIFVTVVLLLQKILRRRKKKASWTVSDVMKQTEVKTRALLD